MTLSLEEKHARIKKLLLSAEEKDPILIAKSIMKEDFMSLHGPEHHFLDGGALLVALSRAGLSFDLEKALTVLDERSFKMPGAMCGYWGMCGSVASITAAFAILEGTGPLSADASYSSHMEFASSLIKKMAEIGGPRCCKRNAFLSLKAGIQYANEHYGVMLPLVSETCDFSPRNKDCIKGRCPFYKGE